MLRVRAMKVSFHETLNDPQTPVHQVPYRWNSDGRSFVAQTRYIYELLSYVKSPGNSKLIISKSQVGLVPMMRGIYS